MSPADARGADPHRAAASRIEVFAVEGLPELRPGDDLAGAVAAAAPWLRDGDVLAVTSKAMSKVEGRLVSAPGDADAREAVRRAAIDEETEAVVATRGPLRIVRSRLGFVMAAAGVDASNVRRDEIALLPLDPDASAADLRARLRERLGVEVAVVVTDTAGRSWRGGLVDVAIGVSGMAAVRDFRGEVDDHGNELAVTEMADADAVAAVSDLVKGKLAGVPVAVVRGMSYLPDDGQGAATLRRPLVDDLFRLGTREVVGARTTAREFTAAAVDPGAIRRSVSAAATAPRTVESSAAQTPPWRFVHVADPGRRGKLLAAMRRAWEADLRAGGRSDEAATLRVVQDDLLRAAPEVVLPFLVDDSPAGPGLTSWLTAGAAVENFLVQLSAEGLGACWVSAPIHCADAVRDVLELPAGWHPLGAIAVGHPVGGPRDGEPPDVPDLLVPR